MDKNQKLVESITRIDLVNNSVKGVCKARDFQEKEVDNYLHEEYDRMKDDEETEED